VTYTPNPADTSGIFLDRDLEDLVEYLAKNTHENWAAIRIRQGWRYGTARNDAQKTHPCLVPFEELPESEREHDRSVVQEMLKALVLLGFDIQKRQRDEP